MKLGLIIGFSLLATTNIIAQDANVRKLKNYPYNASITVAGNTCVLSCDKNTDSFSIIKGANQLWQLANKKDSSKLAVLQLNTMHYAELQNQYDTIDNNKLAALLLIEKLINRATDKGGVLKFVNDKTDNTIATENEIPTADAATEDDLQVKNTTQVNWPLYLLGSLLALVSGLYLYEKTKKTKPQNNVTAEPKDATTQIVQLQQTNQNLLTQLKSLSAQLDADRDKDAAYFTNALSALVNPIKTALTKQNKQEVVTLAMQIVVQYIAYTHYKTDRLQGSDDYNLQTLSNTDLFGKAGKQQSISNSTATDAIPNELKTILAILKDLHADVPNGLSYMGYAWQ
jgi:hypothetical protein